MKGKKKEENVFVNGDGRKKVKEIANQRVSVYAGNGFSPFN